MAICAVLCFCLAAVATQSKIDFTGMMGIMLVFAIALLVLTILFIFIPSRGLMWIIMIGAVVLISIYFIIDIQLMMGGNHKFALSPEDYILAATLLYVDIVYLFVYILMILGRGE